ncbi:hypothetical protein F5Y06DRAFT_302420 [Hypoxylon sp. FL0890]|nr:hypothetical protein F5Y06DRAFT_302420 [Hypoxylon sp. FL0890]
MDSVDCPPPPFPRLGPISDPAPTLVPDNDILRNSSAPDLAKYFRELLKKIHEGNLIAHLSGAIDSEAVPPTVVHVYLSVCKDPCAITYALAQSRSFIARRVAINHFIRMCRSDSFQNMWLTIGAVRGMVALMATMSVREVNLLCRGIGKCMSMRSPVPIRELCFSKLFRALKNTGGMGGGFTHKNFDSRSLSPYYNKILTACLPDIVLQEASRNIKFRGKVCHTHVRDYQRRFLTQVFSPVSAGQTITPYKFVLEGSAVDFSLSVLRSFSIIPSCLRANAENLFDDLVRPLARRLCNRRAGPHLQLDLYALIVKCINVEPSIGNALDYSIISYAIRAWNRARERQDIMKGLLKILLSLTPQTYQWTLDRIVTELQHVQPGLRFPLLQLLLQNARPFKVDISNASSEELRSLGDTWPPRLFYLLPSGISLRFFHLLRAVHPHGKFIAADEHGTLEAVMRDTSYHGKQFGDSNIFSTLLHLRHHGRDSSDIRWLSEVKEVLQERKSKAMSMRNAEERANWTQSAVLLSIASGSLQLYENTILWAQKFDRDATIANRLFLKDTLLSREGLDLLSGIPQLNTDHTHSLTQLERNIKQANRVLMHYMEMASTQLSFGTFDKDSLLNFQTMPSRIVWRRAELLDALQGGKGVTDDDIYESVWKPSIDMLLGFEHFDLQKGHKPLYFNGIKGPLIGQSPAVNPKAHFCKFLDELGKSRDQFWQEYRSKRHPEVTKIGTPWPRGLPIQHLTPAIPSAWKNMPYLESRARAILFAPRGTLLDPLPADEGTRAAIGPFVDSFVFALRVFSSAVNNWSEREERMQQKHFFDLAEGITLPDSIAAPFRISNLELPAHVSSVNPIEWNPGRTSVHFPPVPHIIQHSVKFAESCLDCMLRTDDAQNSRCSDTLISYLQTLKPELIHAGKTQSIWGCQGSLKDLTPSQRDALIAVVIEVLNAKYGMASSLFTLPFPSSEDVRFPALYLGNKFLKEQENIGTLDSMLRILDSLLASVPVQLLQRLTRSIWNRLEARKNGNNEVFAAFVEIIKRLARGDSPQAASEFIRVAVLKYQDEGPFHKYLPSADFLSRLHPYYTQGLSHNLAHAIKNRLRLQQRTAKTRERRNKPPAPPLVEAITVKSAAQLMCQTKYVSPAFVRELLVDLFQNSTHADMQVAIVESLVQIKSRSSQKNIQSSIIRILQKHVVPIAASVNERRPPTEAEWSKAEAGAGPLPEVYGSGSMSDLPPIIRLLVDAIPTPPTAADIVGQKRHMLWMKRIILPILKGSAKNHQRWTALFLKLNGFDLNVKDLPPVPLNPMLLADLFCNYPEYFPHSTFNTIKDVVKININPGNSISIINETIRKNFELLQSNARKHWLSVWNTSESASNLGATQFAHLLFNRTMNSTEKALGGATIETLKSFITEIAEIYLSTSDACGYNMFMEELDFPGYICSSETHNFFNSNCLPLLNGFVARINSLRTPDWQRDPNRQPGKLPDTWPIQLQILRGKHWQQSCETPETFDIREFVRDVNSLIQQFSSEHRPWRERWITLKKAALQQFQKRHFVSLAVEFGSLHKLETPDRTLANYLRFQLAIEFMLEAENLKDEKLIAEMQRFLGCWRNYPEESVGDKSLDPTARFDTPDEVNSFLNTFAARGYNQLDTARTYSPMAPGSSEQRLADVAAGDRFLIDTKVASSEPGAHTKEEVLTSSEPGAHTKEKVLKNIDLSLDALKVKQINIEYLHRPDRTTPFEQACEAMDQAYKEGKFKQWGISNYKAEEVQRFIDICEERGFVKPTVYQGQYNAIVRGGEKELFPVLRKHGIAFYAYSPAAAGIFAGTHKQIKAGSRYDQSHFLGRIYSRFYLKPSILEAADKAVAVAAKHGISGHAAALRWTTYHGVLSKEHGDAIVIGASSVEQLQANIDAAEEGPLPDDVVAALDGVYEEIGDGEETPYWL